MANSSIEHINALHSNLKKWMNRFNGAARKYSSNYIKWFKWLQIFDTDKEIIKAKNFIVQSNVIHSYIKVKELKIENQCMITYAIFCELYYNKCYKSYNLMNNSNFRRSKDYSC